LGTSYITYKETEGAITAFASLDKTYFQGRKLHIFPSQKKPPPPPLPELSELEIENKK
jgi:hypothetical protein